MAAIFLRRLSVALVAALALLVLGRGAALHAQEEPQTPVAAATALAVQTIAPPTIQAVSTDGRHTCALTLEGGAECWGANYVGQLGDASTIPRLTPVGVANLGSGIQAITLGHDYTCALTGEGGVKCWGWNEYGQLGDGTGGDNQYLWSPVDVVGLGSGVQAVSAGGGHTCALTTEGGLKCWGHNGSGQLGDGTTESSSTPVDVVGLGSGVQAVAAGSGHTCAVTTEGGVKCWGRNGFGRLGDGTTEVRLTPVDVVGLGSGVQAVAAGREHTCALTIEGGVKCWGYNGSGKLGDGTTEVRLTPVDVVGLGSGVQAVAAGYEHTCAVTTDGGAKCWGANWSGQLGDGTSGEHFIPVDVASLGSGVQAISAGVDHTCAVTTAGDVKCWGGNSYGQLGDGTTTSRPLPVNVVWAVDTDGDGLLDIWERYGVTSDPDDEGPVEPKFIDLPAMGADPQKPDIFLHIDWMENARHSHKLNSNAIRTVVEAFANSRYLGPTYSVGINLHVDQGPDSILNFATGALWGDLSRARARGHINMLGSVDANGNYVWTDFDRLKNVSDGFTNSGRSGIFHYVIAAHSIDALGHSGVSRGIPASDFIISLGTFSGGNGTILQQTGTLMHELGHNLGLCHGGPFDLADRDDQCEVNYKPNYLSVMNYAFQMDGLVRADSIAIFDFSHSSLPDLLESSLSERTGLMSTVGGYGTRHYCSPPDAGTGNWVPVTNLTSYAPIDWNCDGDTSDTSIQYDINGENGNNERLVSYEDWWHLKFRGGAIGPAGGVPSLPTITPVMDELTVEMAERIVPYNSTENNVYLPMIQP